MSPRRRQWEGPLLAAVALAVTALAAGWCADPVPGDLGLEQPIAFSHRFHVAGKAISCFFCHEGAAWGARAGIPPLQTCMLCHDRVAIHHPQVSLLRSYYAANEPVPWVLVSGAPEFVFFNHQLHVRVAFDCGECHGDVAAMDRVVPRQSFTMGFCLDCHREEGAADDCLACHR